MRFTPPELSRSALDAAPDAMFIVDGDGVIRFANTQAFILFGYDREQIVGTSIEKLIPQRFHERHRAHRATYMGQMRARPMGQNLELYALRHDGAFVTELAYVQGREP